MEVDLIEKLGYFVQKRAHLCIVIIKKDILILGKSSTNALDDPKLTAEEEF